MPKSIRFCRPVILKGQRPQRTESRSERNRFYAGTAWREIRAAFLRENPLCAQCTREGRTTLAGVVHHIIERLIRPDLALDWDNLESSCNPCHTRRHKERTP